MDNFVVILLHLISVATVAIGLSTTKVIRTTATFPTTNYYPATSVTRTTLLVTDHVIRTTARTVSVVPSTTTVRPPTDSPPTSVIVTTTKSSPTSSTLSSSATVIISSSSVVTQSSTAPSNSTPTPAPSTSTSPSLSSTPAPSTSTSPSLSSTPTSTPAPSTSTSPSPSSTPTPAPSTSTSPSPSSTTTSTPAAVNCPPEYHLTWYWIGYFVPDPESPTSNHILGVDTVQSCQEACMSSAEVNRCKSFVFSPGERKCTLYDFRFNQPGRTFIKSRNTFYFQWQCKNYTLPGCPSTQELAVYRFLNQTYFDAGAGNQEQIAVSSEDQCEQACVNTWGAEGACLSYNYDRTNGSNCLLNRKSMEEEQLVQNANYVFVGQTCFKDPGICSERTQDNRVWHVFANRTYFKEPDGEEDVISGVTSYIGCQNLCFYEEKRTCKAVVYRPQSEECLIYRKLYEKDIKVGEEVYYYECPEINAKVCSTNTELIWVEFKGRRLRTQRNEVLHDVRTARECQKRCMEFSHWLCRSVEYDGTTMTCTLSGMNRGQQLDLLEEDKTGKDGVSYYEWLCKLETCFSQQKKVYFETKRKILKYHDDVVYEDISTLHECLSRCTDLTAFTCRSLEYSDNTMTCRLSEVTAAEAEPGDLVDSSEQEYRYVEWRCRSYNQDRCRSEDDAILYWSEAPQSKLSGGYILRAGNIHSQSKCEEVCFNTSECESVQYKIQSSDCELNNYNTKLKQLVSTDIYKYLEWRCAKPEYEPCLDDEEVYWQAFVGRRYRNPSKLTITRPNVSTPIACEHLCLKAKQELLINCESVQYYHDNGTCFLFSGTARRDQLEPDDVGYEYLERHCRKVNFNRCTPGTSFRVHVTLKRRALVSDPHGAVHNVSSLKECRDLCEQYRYFECVSIDYSMAEGKCVLHAVGQMDGFHASISSSYDYYEMECIVPPTPTSSGVDSLRRPLFLISLLYISASFIGKSRVLS